MEFHKQQEEGTVILFGIIDAHHRTVISLPMALKDVQRPYIGVKDYSEATPFYCPDSVLGLFVFRTEPKHPRVTFRLLGKLRSFAATVAFLL